MAVVFTAEKADIMEHMGRDRAEVKFLYRQAYQLAGMMNREQDLIELKEKYEGRYHEKIDQ